jgi:hypothetical protein
MQEKYIMFFKETILRNESGEREYMGDPVKYRVVSETAQDYMLGQNTPVPKSKEGKTYKIGKIVRDK